jgi:hypothetical protein
MSFFHGFFMTLLKVNVNNSLRARTTTDCHGEVLEWLIGWTANPMGSARVSSNLILVDCFLKSLFLVDFSVDILKIQKNREDLKNEEIFKFIMKIQFFKSHIDNR